MTAPAIPRALRTAITRRSGGVCEMQLDGCVGTATDWSHRVAKGMGGVHRSGATAANRLANALHACWWCHRWVTRNSTAANGLGLTLKHGQDPDTEPALRRGVLVLLDDGGNIRPYLP